MKALAISLRELRASYTIMSTLASLLKKKKEISIGKIVHLPTLRTAYGGGGSHFQKYREKYDYIKKGQANLGQHYVLIS